MRGQFTENKIYAVPRNEGETIVFDVETGGLFVAERNVDKICCDDIKELQIEKLQNNVPQKMKQNLYKVSIASAESCNLRCKYCYAESGTYGHQGNSLMSFESYQKMYADILKIVPKGPGAICFFGGEPLLDYVAIKQFVTYVKELNKNEKVRLPIWEMVTNGTLFDDEKIIFFKDNNFKISISLDGPKSINDISRVFPDETLSVFDSVKCSMDKIKKHDFKVSCGSTLDIPFFEKYQRGRYSSYLEALYGLGFRYVGTNIAATDKSDNISDEIVSKIEIFADDMVEHDFHILSNNGDLSRVSNLVLNIIQRISNPKYEIGCVPGANTIFYSLSGKYYPCHLMYESRKNEILYDEMKDGMEVECYDRNLIEPCNLCQCRNLCMFWCPAMFPVNSNHPNSSTCLFQKSIFEAVMVRLVDVMENESIINKFVENVKDASLISKRYEIED